MLSAWFVAATRHAAVHYILVDCLITPHPSAPFAFAPSLCTALPYAPLATSAHRPHLVYYVPSNLLINLINDDDNANVNSLVQQICLSPAACLRNLFSKGRRAAGGAAINHHTRCMDTKAEGGLSGDLIGKGGMRAVGNNRTGR